MKDEALRPLATYIASQFTTEGEKHQTSNRESCILFLLTRHALRTYLLNGGIISVLHIVKLGISWSQLNKRQVNEYHYFALRHVVGSLREALEKARKQMLRAHCVQSGRYHVREFYARTVLHTYEREFYPSPQTHTHKSELSGKWNHAPW